MSVKKCLNALEYYGDSYGCFLRNGKLAPAYNTLYKYASCPEWAVFAAYSHTAGKLFICTSTALFVSDDGKSFAKFCDFDECSPFMLEDVGGAAARTAVVAGKYAAVYESGAFTIERVRFALSCGAVHCGRVFGADAADGLVLRWSGAGGLLDWAEGIDGSGYVKLDPARGKILDILPFSGKLVAVREYGLTVLGMYGSPENFSVDITDTDCERIYKNTARVYGGKLYFVTKTGIKYFDGNKISPLKIMHEILSPVCAVEFGGKYFIACEKDYVICADLSDGASCRFLGQAETLFVNDAVFFCGTGAYFKLDCGGAYMFESGAIDFGNGSLKTVTEIDVRGVAQIRISNGKKVRDFLNASGIIRPCMRGKKFFISAEGKSPLDGIAVTAEVMNGI